MPIIEIKNKKVELFCSVCGRKRQLDLSALKVGKQLGNESITDCIIIPPCPDCNSIENLLRTFDREELQLGQRTPNWRDKHAAKVNALHQKLGDDDQFDSDEIKTKLKAEASSKKPKWKDKKLESKVSGKLPPVFQKLIDNNPNNST
jgi:hypothetical protein